MVSAGFLAGIVANKIKEFTSIPVYLATVPAPSPHDQMIMVKHVRTDRSTLTSQFFLRSLFSVYWFGKADQVERGFLNFLQKVNPYSDFFDVLHPNGHHLSCRLQLITEGSIDFDSDLGMYTRFYEILMEVIYE